MQKLVVSAMRPLKMVKGIIEFRFGMNIDQRYGQGPIETGHWASHIINLIYAVKLVKKEAKKQNKDALN